MVTMSVTTYESARQSDCYRFRSTHVPLVITPLVVGEIPRSGCWVLRIDRHLDGFATAARDHLPTHAAIGNECAFADDVVFHGVPIL